MESLPLAFTLLTGFLGVLAGVLSTSAGFGGGIVLTAGLGLALGPVEGLAVAAPALMVGHLHRAVAMRHAVDRAVALRFAIGALPGAVLGGVALVALPATAVWWILGAASLFAMAEGLGWVPTTWGRRAVVPGGAAVGFLASSAGVGGVLLPPTLLGAGLRGPVFVATAAVGAVAVHVGRIGAYAAADMFDMGILTFSGAVAVGVIFGNWLGHYVLRRMTLARQRRVAHVILALSLLTAAYGIL